MPEETPLIAVTSEANRTLEDDIVTGTLRRAHGIGLHRDIDDIFNVGIEGISDHPEQFSDSVRAVIMANIEAGAETYGLEVFHKYRWSLDFKLRKRKRL